MKETCPDIDTSSKNRESNLEIKNNPDLIIDSLNAEYEKRKKEYEIERKIKQLNKYNNNIFKKAEITNDDSNLTIDNEYMKSQQTSK